MIEPKAKIGNALTSVEAMTNVGRVATFQVPPSLVALLFPTTTSGEHLTN